MLNVIEFRLTARFSAGQDSGGGGDILYSREERERERGEYY